jgi:hypothetical protein
MIKTRTLLKYVIPINLALIVVLMVLDYQKVDEIPRYRRSDGQFWNHVSEPLPPVKGLDTLHVSGSRRPTQGGLIKYLSNVNMPVYIFDLQEEGHYFINGLPETWYGYDRVDEVGVNQKKAGARHYYRRLLHTGKLTHTVADVRSEKQMIEDCGFNYLGISMDRRHIPLKEQVDEFVKIVDSLPQPSWVHFHCNAGRGRTSIAMVMMDILRNGKEVSLDDIVQRQHFLGSENIIDTVVWAKKSTYSQRRLEIRRDFLRAFHRYVNDPEGYGATTWLEWAAKNNIYDTLQY